MNVRVPGVRKLFNMTERRNPLLAVTHVTRQGTTTRYSLKARTQHATQDGTMTKLGPNELMDDRTGTPVVCPQRRARPQQFIIGDDETELDLSLGSRSFLIG